MEAVRVAVRVAVDIETTGLIKGVSEIIEVAFIPFDTNYKPITKFVSYIKPLRGIQPEAYKINNISEADLIGAPSPLQVRNIFMEWKESIFNDTKFELLGHGIGTFDIPFLELFFGFNLYHSNFSHRYSDTLVLTRAIRDAGLIPNTTKTSLTSILEYFEIERVRAHSAYSDALACISLWVKLISLIK